MKNDFVPSTTREELRNFPAKTKRGLYYVFNGRKVVPENLYFSLDLREWHNDKSEVNGRAYTHAHCGLYPVFTKNGKRFRIKELCGVSARYKNGIVCDYYIE